MKELPASHLGLMAPSAMSNTPTRSGAILPTCHCKTGTENSLRRTDRRFSLPSQTPIGQPRPRSVRCLLTNPASRLGQSPAQPLRLSTKQQQRRLTAIEMLKFFDWSYRAGAKLADELQYVPIPKDVVQMIESAWAQVTDAGGQSAWTEPTTARAFPAHVDT